VAGYDEKISEEMYIDEIDAFVKAVKGETTYPYTLEEDKRILDVLKDLEQSSDDKTQVKT
jgi:hypothetical protein